MWLNRKQPKDGIRVQQCTKCKVLILDRDAQYINNMGYLTYFCIQHRPNYDEIQIEGRILVYYKKLEVDEDGEPVGYEKTKRS